MKTSQTSINLVNPKGKIEFGPSRADGLKGVLNFENFISKNNKIVGCVLNFDGSLLYTLDSFKNFTVIHIKNKRYTTISKCHFDGPLQSVKCGKEYLLLPRENKIIDVFSLYENKIIHSLIGHKLKIRALRFNPIKNIVMSLSVDGIMLWDVPSFKAIKSIFIEKPQFKDANFSEDGLSIIALQNDNRFRIYGLGTFQEEKSNFLDPAFKINDFAYTVDSSKIIFGGDMPFFFVYDVLTNQLTEKNFVSANSSTAKMKLGYQNTLAVVHDHGREMIFYDLNNDFAIISSYSLPSNLVIRDFSLDFENNFIAFVSNLGSIFLYELPNLLNFLKQKPWKSNPEITFSLTTVSPNYNTLITEQERNKDFPLIPESYSKEKSPENEGEASNSETSGVLKENISVGYLNHSIKEEKLSNISSISINPSKKNKRTSDSAMVINKKELETMLKLNKRFPEKNRLFIWKTVLQLPENKEAFDNLLKRGIAPKFLDLYKKYQLKSENTFRKLQRILSAFCHYSPAFLNVPFLQDLIFPFIKLFGHNELLCFEVILSFFLNWGQHFFECAPHPPVNFFKCVNEVIRNEDQDLWDFFQKHSVSSIFFLWPSFQVLFTDLLDKEQWLSLMDFLVLNHEKPELLVYFSAVLLLFSKHRIVTEIQPLGLCEGGFSLEKMLNSVERIENKVAFNFPTLDFKRNLPIIKEQYPIHNFYPSQDLEEHKKLRRRIVEEEERLVEQRTRVTLSGIEAVTKDLVGAQDALKQDWMRFNRKVDEEKELLRLEQEIIMNKRMDQENNNNMATILRMEETENNFKRNWRELEECRELEKMTIGKEVEFKKRLEDLAIASKLKDEALNTQHFNLMMKMSDWMKQRERLEGDKEQAQERRFHETKQFYEGSLKDQKLREEKDLQLLKADLELKKQAVEANLLQELDSKKRNNEDFLMGLINKDLQKTMGCNMREIDQEFEKKRLITGQFNQFGTLKSQESFNDRRKWSPGEEDQRMKGLKEGLRERITREKDTYFE